MARHVFVLMTFLVFAIVGTMLVFLPGISKEVKTDQEFSAPLSNYSSYVMRRINWYNTSFRAAAQKGFGPDQVCFSWYFSGPVDVYYQVTSAQAKDFDGLRWYRYTSERDKLLWNGAGLYNFMFVRTTSQPVYLLHSNAGPKGLCGRVGSSDKFFELASPIDVFTDFLGLKRLASHFDDEQRFAGTNPPPTSATARSNAEARFLFRADAPRQPVRVTPKPAPAQTARVQPRVQTPPPPPSYRMPDMNYWRQVAESNRGRPFVQFTNSQIAAVERHLHYLGFAGEWRIAIPNWKRSRGLISVASIDRRDLLSLMAQSKGDVAPQQVSLTKDEWINVQRRLKQLGHNPGAIDGIIGAQTRRAIASWQRSHNAFPNGVLRPKQLRALLRN